MVNGAIEPELTDQAGQINFPGQCLTDEQKMRFRVILADGGKLGQAPGDLFVPVELADGREDKGVSR